MNIAKKNPIRELKETNVEYKKLCLNILNIPDINNSNII